MTRLAHLTWYKDHPEQEKDQRIDMNFGDFHGLTALLLPNGSLFLRRRGFGTTTLPLDPISSLRMLFHKANPNFTLKTKKYDSLFTADNDL